MDITFMDIRFGRLDVVRNISYIAYSVIIDGNYESRYYTIPDHELAYLNINGPEGVANYLYQKEFEPIKIEEGN